MKQLLVFSDVHCKTRHCDRLLEKSRQADLVIGAGDFANFRKDLGKTWDILRQIEKPVIIVPGNHESPEELQEECGKLDNVHILHGNEVTIDGVSIFGIGAAIPTTPFGKWSYDLSEDEAAELMSGFNSHDILVSHSPPKGTLDKNRLWMSLGSTTIRDAITTHKPKYCICGHIHESSGKQKVLEETTVVNAGPKGIMLEL